MSHEHSKGDPASQRNFKDDYREGEERRSWEERRKNERRKSTQDVPHERRSEPNRRSGNDRRVMLLDRRRRTSEPYALQHAELIRAMLLDPDSAAACPRCDGPLLLGQPTPKGDSFVREVRCTKCRHSVLISGLPARLPSEEVKRQ